MAVTSQLARLTPAQLTECRRSVAALDQLCSFELVPASEHLDLDWASEGLIRICEHTRDAVRRALTGDDEVNPAYRYTVMEQPRFLEPPDVAALSAVLRGIDLDQVLSTTKQPLTGLTADPRSYLTGHFTALRDFYATAADRRLAVVIWCD